MNSPRFDRFFNGAIDHEPFDYQRRQSHINRTWPPIPSCKGAAPSRARNWFSRRTATLNNDTLQRSLDSVCFPSTLLEEAYVAGRNVEQIYSQSSKCRQNLLDHRPAPIKLLPL